MSGKPDDEDENRTQPELPSVIIDPSLLAESAAPAPTPAQVSSSAPPSPSSAPPSNGHADEPATTDADRLDLPAPVAAGFSAQDADRFAASIRPSWEPPAPIGTGAPSAVVAHDAPARAGGPAEVEAIPGVPIARTMTSGRAAALTGLAILAFGTLVVVAMTGGEAERPASWTERASAPAANAPPPEDVAAPAPAPVPAAPPPPPAAPAATVAPPPAPTTASAPVEQPATASPTATPTAEAAAPAPAAPVAAPPAPAPAQKVERVRLQVKTTPRTAKLRLDGRPVSNPLDASMPAGSQHRVEASAPGYVTRSLAVSTDRARAITIELERAHARTTTTSTARAKTPATSAPKKPASSKGAAFVSDSPY